MDEGKSKKLLFEDSRLKAFEGTRGRGDDSDERVERLSGVISVVALALEFHPDAARHVANTLLPDLLVDGCVNADIGRLHGVDGKRTHGLDGLGRLLLEGRTVHALVQVNCVLAGNDIGRDTALLLFPSHDAYLCDW